VALSSKLAVLGGFLLVTALPQQTGPRVVATLEDPAVTEASGIAASRLHRGIYWTHNDSGDGPAVYAFDGRGRSYGRWTVPSAGNIDWEDIAVSPGPERGQWYLYVADIGDNSRRRDAVIVYRIPEPKVGEPSACRQGCRTEVAEALRFRYPDGAHDAEALLVHPTTGDLYIVTKAGQGDPATTVFVARSRQISTRDARLTKLATLELPDQLYKSIAGGLTGGDISPDGKRVVFSDYLRLYEAAVPARGPFDEVWKERFSVTPTGVAVQVEGVCYRSDGNALVAVSEGTPATVLESAR